MPELLELFTATPVKIETSDGYIMSDGRLASRDANGKQAFSVTWDESKHPRNKSGEWTAGATESASSVIERVKASPNQPEDRNWERYADQFGIEGDFHHVEIPTDHLVKNLNSGHLRRSNTLNQDTVIKKIKSGDRNPVIITQEPGRQHLVVDGNHSLQAAINNGDKHVKAIVSKKSGLASQFTGDHGRWTDDNAKSHLDSIMSKYDLTKSVHGKSPTVRYTDEEAGTTNDDLMGAGYGVWNGGSIELRRAFMSSAHKQPDMQERANRHKMLIPSLEKEIASLKEQEKIEKGARKKSIQKLIKDRQGVLDEMTLARRTFTHEDAPSDMIERSVIAHEAGHAIDAMFEVNFSKAIRDVGGVDKKDLYAVSIYGASHPSEMFAEITALKETGRWHEVPKKLQEAYELATKHIPVKDKHGAD